jgi:hypothetical protein
MKARTTLVLAVLAVGAVAVGWFFGTRPATEQLHEVAAGTPVFAKLGPRLGQAARVEIVTAKATLVLAQQDGRWVLPDRANYPADQTRVRQLLIGLVELRRTEPRTADAGEYARLGVEDPHLANSSAKLLRVLDAAGRPLAELIVGRTWSRTRGDLPESVYIRGPSEAQAWLAEGSLPVDDDAPSWISRAIADIPPERIASVVTTRGTQRLEFTRVKDVMTLTAPAEHPQLDQFKVDDVGRALDHLTLTDVKPAGQVPGATIGQTVLTTTDGMVVQATVNKAGADVWVVLSARGDGAAKGEAAALQARVDGWAYAVGSWKESALVPTMDDLKASEPPPTPAAGATAAPSAPPAEPAAASPPPAATGAAASPEPAAAAPAAAPAQ